MSDNRPKKGRKKGKDKKKFIPGSVKDNTKKRNIFQRKFGSTNKTVQRGNAPIKMGLRSTYDSIEFQSTFNSFNNPKFDRVSATTSGGKGIPKRLLGSQNTMKKAKLTAQRTRRTKAKLPVLKLEVDFEKLEEEEPETMIPDVSNSTSEVKRLCFTSAADIEKNNLGVKPRHIVEHNLDDSYGSLDAGEEDLYSIGDGEDKSVISVLNVNFTSMATVDVDFEVSERKKKKSRVKIENVRLVDFNLNDDDI